MKRADTIAALATASDKGALAVIRISGQGAFDIFARCVKERERFVRSADRRIGLYTVVDDSGGVVDQVTAVRYEGPRSYTGENMVEVITHGGGVAPSMVLGVVLQAGARAAEAGEFTLRAVLAGKMSVLEAEAMDALIRSESAEDHRAAIACYGGEQQRALERIRERLERLLVGLEASLELEGLDEAMASDVRDEVGMVCGEMERALQAYERGQKAGALPRVVIAGESNAGKSTLFNVLLGRERSIVDASRGTTRDYVVEAVELGGVRVEVVDTAGLGAGQGRIVD
ncbi:MAG: GTP-binding protein, partial [Chitinivibrionales bacterium]|nr:GTP-binding protein [Chitinivibrionales bacterium]